MLFCGECLVAQARQGFVEHLLALLQRERGCSGYGIEIDSSTPIFKPPFNPNTGQVEGDRCYPDLASIPGGVDAVVIETRPEKLESSTALGAV